uniref:Calsyntenin-1 n=1 Tax=Panagrellus redivivus TaxID=6233 RepID=A0A7E4ZS07_PANRE
MVVRIFTRALLALLVVTASAKTFHRTPVIDLHGAEELIGLIREDQQVVSVAPRLAIFTETGPICKYDLIATNGEDLPFEAVVQDEHDGSAIIKIKDGMTLDCATSEYNVRVVAVRCAEEHLRSDSAPLKITVKDTNNHSPEFDAPWYSFDAVEGHIYKELAKIIATDKDCGQPYGTICRYEITNALEKSPFRLSDEGVLSNIVPLNYSESQSHILTVVAHDCGMRRSKSTLITVNVVPKCVNKVERLASELEHTPGQAMAFAENAEVTFCKDEGKECAVKEVEAKLTLRNYADNGVNSGCGLDPATVDLLAKPIEKNAPLSPEDEDEGEDDDDDDELSSSEEADDVDSEEKYMFDGKSNSVIVPSSAIKAPVPERFTLTFSMKHARGSIEDQKRKQNILCESDEDHLNRHHFAVYVRHCKLELLLRREAEHATAEFRAAEWRWSMDEVCDNEWHSYAIVFHDLDNVQLFADGKEFTSTGRNPEILDDWPLHQTKALKTKMVVGACWHARSQSMVQYFDGYLSGMKLLPGKVDTEKAITCSHEIGDQLVLAASDNSLIPGDSIVFNKAKTELSLKASSRSELERLLRLTKFTSKKNSTVDAAVEIITTQTCKDGRIMKTDMQAIEISSKDDEESDVTESPTTTTTTTAAPTMKAVEKEPLTLSISGINLINTDRRSLKEGTTILPALELIVTKVGKDNKAQDVTEGQKINLCKVSMKPARDMDLEYFSSPAALIASLNVDFEHDKQGITLRGEETVKGYREILSKIHYFNTRPESYNKKLYTVQCTLSDSVTVSNEFTVTMTVDGADDADATVEELPMKSLESLVDSIDAEALTESNETPKFGKAYEPSFESNRLQNILEMDLPRPKALLSHRGYEVGQGAVAGGAIAIVVVICVGFLLVLLVVGVLKMRDTPIQTGRRRKHRTPSEGMEWDDAGMNITMNPLEDLEKNASGAGVFSDEEDEDDDGDSSDEIESYHDEEDLTEDDEDSEVLPHSPNGRPGLEWDDSTLTNVSRTYRI